jgi:hypothetical protein
MAHKKMEEEIFLDFGKFSVDFPDPGVLAILLSGKSSLVKRSL